MRQAKIQWGGHPLRANPARAAALTRTSAPPPMVLYTGMAGLGLAAGAMLIAAGLARQPDIGVLRAPPVPAETLPAPAERPAAPVMAASEPPTRGRLAEPAPPSAPAAADGVAATPVAARFGEVAAGPVADPPLAAPSDAGRPDPGLAAFAGSDTPSGAPAPGAADLASGAVEVAVTEAEVLAIEARLAAEGDPNFVLPPETGTDAAEPPLPAAAIETAAAQPVQQADLPAAWASEHVNLRAGPDNDAPVLAIIPGNAAFAAEEGCEHWCRAVHEGQSGYVYSSFIRRDAP